MDYRMYVNDGAYENIRKLCIERNPNSTMSACKGCRYSYQYIVKTDDTNYDSGACCIFGDMPQSWKE